MRRTSLRALAGVALAAPLAAVMVTAVPGCSQQNIQTPTRSLDRPSDVALVCAVTSPDTNRTVMQPLSACNSDNEFAGLVVDGGTGAMPTDAGTQVAHASLLALATNTARGEVAIATTARTNLGPLTGNVDSNGIPTRALHTDGAAIINLDPAHPGFGFVPVGSMPQHIRTTDDGCRAVTSNTDSCDLSVIDVYGTLLTQTGEVPRSSFPSDQVRRVIPHARGTPACPGSGCTPLGARPSWVELTPATSGQGGSTCTSPTAYHAFVAFPSCALVAEVDLTSGELVQALEVTTTGAFPVDPGSVSCPHECAGLGPSTSGGGNPLDLGAPDAPMGSPTDLGASDGSGSGGPDASGVVLDGGSTGPVDASSVGSDGASGAGDGGLPPIVTASQALPRSFAVYADPSFPERNRLYIADAVADHLVRVDLVAQAGRPDSFGAVSLVPLESPGGVEAVRLSPPILDPTPQPPLPTATCNVDGDCAGGLHCTGTAGTCVPCTADAQCRPGAACSGHQCVPTIRYLYAIARDHSLRVVDADNGWECDTNPDGKVLSQDPRYRLFDSAAQPVNDPFSVEWALRCLRNDNPAKPPRNPLAKGPGIVLPAESLPRDVAFIYLPLPNAVTSGTGAIANPGLTIGDIAWVVDSAGRISAINLFDHCPQPNDPNRGGQPAQACDPTLFVPSENTPPSTSSNGFGAFCNSAHPVPVPLEVMPNRLRSGNPRFAHTTSLSDADGSPRLGDAPTVLSPGPAGQPTPFFCQLADDVGGAVCGGFNAVDGGTGPVDGGAVGASGLCQNPPTSGFGNTVTFREPSVVRNETWTFEWEGALVGTNRTGGFLGYDASTRRHTFGDAIGGLCARTLQPGDKVFLNGCGGDGDCSIADTCYLDPAAADPTHGLCVSRDPAKLAMVRSGACASWTQSTLRYRVVDPGDATMGLDELPDPEHPADTHACTLGGPASQCADVNVLGQQQTVLTTSCLPVGQGGATCLRACTLGVNSAINPAGACGIGYVCAQSQYDPAGVGRCLRAPLPPTDPALATLCFGQLQIYELHAGESFVVRGTVSGSLANGFVDPSTGLCAVPGPGGRHEQSAGLRLARVPIDPGQACASNSFALDPLPPGAPDPCTLTPPGGDPDHTFIRFGNPVFDTIIVVPRSFVTAAMASAPPDGGTTDDAGVTSGTDGGAAPMVGPGVVYSRVPVEGALLSFPSTGGFRPLSFNLGFDIAAQLPRSAESGPNRREIYIVDEGKQSAATGLRGQLIRFLADNQASDNNFVIR